MFGKWSRVICVLVLGCILAIAFVCNAVAEGYKEAPMLSELVEAGKLPPLEKRLPESPQVIEPVDQIGQYGGTWRRAMLGIGDRAGIDRITWDPLVRFDWDDTTIAPNVAEAWEISENGTVITFSLRKGIKWSDGVPFTAKDILFWYEDVLMNEELTPVFPSWLTVDGGKGVVEEVDEYTVRFRFPASYGAFLICLAGNYGCEMYTPRHYLEQFHPKYTPMEELDSMAKAAGVDEWYRFFALKNNVLENPDMPTIRPWKLVTKMSPPRITHERNPYYWKVDSEGNQLPYIDRVVHDIVDNIEVINFKALSGEIDMQTRHITWENYPLFMENRQKGDYEILEWRLAEGSNAVLAPNLNHKDPVIKELFQDRRFRIALSIAINRDELNEIGYLGLGRPNQITLIEGSPYYDEEAAKMYTEYDPVQANRLLDELGLTERDNEGYRLGADGKPLALTIEFAEIFGPYRDIAEMVKLYWDTVGIQTAIKIQSRELCDQRWNAGTHDIGMFQGDRGFDPFPAPPHWLLPLGHSNVNAPEWGQWYYSLGKQGEKPEGDVLRAFELAGDIMSTTSTTERVELGRELVVLSAQNVWKIGLVGELPAIVIVSNSFKNVPETAVSDYLLRTPGNVHPEQFFIKN